MQILISIKRFCLAVLLFFCVSSFLCSQEDETRGYRVEVGDYAPDFTMTLESGEVVSLSDMRGKVVMLQFTASWCGVCRKEMPYIESDIWAKYASDEGFVLWAIDRDEPIDKIAIIRKTTGVTYPIGLDPKGLIFSKYALPDAGITRNVIIDREGKIVCLTRLFNEAEFKSMCAVLHDLLK